MKLIIDEKKGKLNIDWCNEIEIDELDKDLGDILWRWKHTK